MVLNGQLLPLGLLLDDEYTTLQVCELVLTGLLQCRTLVLLSQEPM